LIHFYKRKKEREMAFLCLIWLPTKAEK